MKKFAALLSAVLCVCLLAVNVTADSSTVYTMDELGVEISLPDDMEVYTRNMDENDPLLSKIGKTPSEISDALVSDSNDLEALSADSKYQLFVDSEVVLNDDLVPDDFRQCDESDLNAISSEAKDSLSSNDAADNFTVYKCSNMNYVLCKYTVTKDNTIYHVLEAIAKYNDKPLNIILSTSAEPISSVWEARFNSILDSITYPEVAAEYVSSTPAVASDSSSTGTSDNSGFNQVRSVGNIVGYCFGLALILFAVIFLIRKISKKKSAEAAATTAANAPTESKPVEDSPSKPADDEQQNNNQL